MYTGPTKAITRSVLNNSKASKLNWELSFVDEFRYVGHVMTAHCRDNKNIGNNSGGKMQLAICCVGVLICTYGGKNPIV